MTEILAGVDITAVATWVGAIGLAIVGISMAFRAIFLSKTAVKMVGK